jgi:hypothetical protein
MGRQAQERASRPRAPEGSHPPPRRPPYRADVTKRRYKARAAKILRNALTPEQGALGGSMFERAEGYNSVTGADAFTGATPAAKTLEAIRGAKERQPEARQRPAVTRAMRAHL